MQKRRPHWVWRPDPAGGPFPLNRKQAKTTKATRKEAKHEKKRTGDSRSSGKPTPNFVAWCDATLR